MKNFGFFLDELNNEICPCHFSGKQLVSGWHLAFPAMADDGYSIQISRKYIICMDSRTHEPLLMSATSDISYDVACQITNLLSFLFDAILEVSYPFTPQDETQHSNFFRGMKNILKIKGQDYPSDIQENYIREINELMQTIQGVSIDGFRRVIPISKYSDKKVISCELPSCRRLKDALDVYKQALIATGFSSQIVNYSRILEALVPKDAAGKTIEHTFTKKIKPVFCKTDPQSDRKFDLIRRYKKFLTPYYQRLLKENGNSHDEIGKFLWKQRRCPSAHAKCDILKTSPSLPLFEIYNDILLLKLVSRNAIQEYWERL